MFKPVPVALVNIQVKEDKVSQATAILARLRLMHLINLVETPLGKLGYLGLPDQGLMERYQRLSEEAAQLCGDLEILPRVLEIPADLNPEKDIFRLAEELEQISKEVRGWQEQLHRNRERLAELERHYENLQELQPSGLRLEELASLRFAVVVPGKLPAAHLEKLTASLETRHHVLIPVSSREDRSVILACFLASDREVVQRALASAFFEPLALPAETGGSIDELLDATARQLEDLRQEQRHLQESRQNLRAALGDRLSWLRHRLDLNRTVLRARTLFGKVNTSYLISGWIPVTSLEKLKTALQEELGGEAALEVMSPETVPGVRQGILKIPILFNNPFLLRPFERLTTTYGVPSYQEVDPTVFLALSFLLMFGMMFGDVGQGAVLFGLGYLIFRRFFRYTDYGIILMECGVSSALFGLLYGTVFGVEGLLPILWFAPMRDIYYFMKVAIIFGVGLISLGLLLSFINALRSPEGRLPVAGVLTALCYWIAAGLGMRYLLTGTWELDWWVAVLVAGMTLLLVVLLVAAKWRHPATAEVPVAEEGRGLRVLEGAIEVVDGTVRYVANTISFVRLAAFALAHAGLFLAVFSLAETLSRLRGGGVLYWLTIILGNAVMIVLEGLVASIQTIRLEYYEFFSKFFHGGGQPFVPLERREIS
jgi:V/A-type H+-transporting ATPase subunit I